MPKPRSPTSPGSPARRVAGLIDDYFGTDTEAKVTAVEQNWQGFKADYHGYRTGTAPPSTERASTSRNSNANSPRQYNQAGTAEQTFWPYNSTNIKFWNTHGTETSECLGHKQFSESLQTTGRAVRVVHTETEYDAVGRPLPSRFSDGHWIALCEEVDEFRVIYRMR
jgi:hypothetical protein